MNTSKKYLKEISYRPAKCCGTCKSFIDVHGQGILYCNRHDNPVSKTSVCKFWQRPTMLAPDVGQAEVVEDNQAIAPRG